MNDYEIKTTDTPEQIKVFGWCHDLGLTTLLEYNVPPYYLDIYLPELKLGIELDGPMHSRKKDAKRDGFIKRRYDIDIWRYKNKHLNNELKEEFFKNIKERAND